MSIRARIRYWMDRADLLRAGIALAGVAFIVYIQLQFQDVDAPFFGLFFWCVTVTRFMGLMPSIASILSSAIVGNIYFLHPRGELSTTGTSGLFCALYVVMAGMCAYMLTSIKGHVTHQQALLLQAERASQENKALADALSRAVSARDTFLAIAGHELKSPVTGLMLQSQVWQRRLAKRVVSQDELKVAWHRQGEALGRLAHLVEELLDVSRINGGQLQLNPDAINLSQMAQDVVGRFGQTAAEAGCDVSVDAPGNVVGEWDRVRLEQVVANLLSNAVKYGAGAPVHVTVRASETEATLSVQDNGRGISAADRERIFECFERVSIERDVEGLGLGLWIVRQIVDATGGNIRLESEEGRGANFTVKLPLRQPKGQNAAPPNKKNVQDLA
jgi:signal transduction histidine kinase